MNKDNSQISSNDLNKIRRDTRKAHKGMIKALKESYGASITRNSSASAMQKLVDLVSSKNPELKPQGGSLSGFIAKRNKKINSRFRPVNTYVGRQGTGGPCDMLMFGLFRMRFNGCEVIATYNVLKYLGFNKDIRDISYDYEMNGSMLLGGFGVRPDAVASYIGSITGRPVDSYGPERYQEYDSLFSGRPAAIYTFWNGPSKWTIHTVAVFHLKNGRIRAYNYYNDRLYSDFDSIESMTGSKREKLVPISLMLP